MALLFSSRIFRFGPRSVALAGAVTAACGWFVASWANGLLGLIGGQSVLTGVGFGLMYIPGVVAVAGVFSKRRSLAIGLALCGSGAGQVLLGPLVGALLEFLGWRNAFRVMSGLCLGCGVAGLLMPTPNKKNIEAEGEVEANVPEVGVWKARVLGRCIAVQEQVPVFLLYALGDGFAVMALYIPYSCIPDLASSSGISPTLATLLIASLGVGSVVGRLSSGWLCDQPWVKPLNLTRMAITVAAPIPLIYAMSPPCFLLLAGLCCLLRKIPFSRSIPRLECRESGSSMSLITANIVKLPNVSIFNCSMLPNVQNRIKYLVE